MFNRSNRSSQLRPKRLRLELLEERRVLDAVTVTIDNDRADADPAHDITELELDPGMDGEISLREAIIAANNTQGPDKITFDPMLFSTARTIEIDSIFPDVTDSLTIDATIPDDPAGGFFDVTIDAQRGGDGVFDNGNGYGIFVVNVPSGSSDTLFSLKGLKLTGADNPGVGGVIDLAKVDHLSISNSVFMENSASSGGVVFGRDNLLPVDAEVDIKDSLFVDNVARTGAGGALYLPRRVGSVTIQSSSFLDNAARTSSGSGGAIRHTGGTLEITGNSQLSGNTADGAGGALYLRGTGSLTIEDAMFVDNTAEKSGGGVYLRFDRLGQKATISRSVFRTNNALDTADQNGGGGLFADLHGTASQTEATQPMMVVEDSTFEDNDAEENAGGIWVCSKFGAKFELRDSTLSGNKAGRIVDDEFFPPSVAGGDGGGIWIGIPGFQPGALFEATLENVTVSGNEALAEGGGVWAGATITTGSDALTTELRHVTITKNTAPGISGNAGQGAGLFSQIDSRIDTTLYNTIVSGNTDDGTVGSPANNVGGAINNVASKFNLFGSNAGVFTGLPPESNPNKWDDDDNPDLGPLTDNDGSTFTHLPNNPDTNEIVDAWDEIDLINEPVQIPEFDQRGGESGKMGFDRVVDFRGGGNKIDIGAVEFQEAALFPTIDEILLDRRTLDSTAWVENAEVSLTDRVANGHQLRAIGTANPNTIEIAFTEDVTPHGSLPSGDPLTLKVTEPNSPGYVTTNELTADSFDSGRDSQNRLVYTWTFNTPLPNGKYSIHLNTTEIKSDDGNNRPLDAVWENDDNGGNTRFNDTPDDLTDDPTANRSFMPDDNVVNEDDVEFRFHFALLAGDYDGNHKVDGVDFLRIQRNDVGMGHEIADVNGDGMVDSQDLAVWTANAYTLFPMRALGGADFNDDEYVGVPDLVIWQAGFYLTPGALTPADGDADGSGDVDGEDFEIWQRKKAGVEPGAMAGLSAWFEAARIDGMNPYDPSFAPTVLNVLVSDSQIPGNVQSFMSLMETGQQLESLGFAVDTISIQFSEEVYATNQTISVTNLDGPSPGQATEYSYDIATQTASWTFGSTFADGQYLITIDDVLDDLSGQILDGELDNPWKFSDASPAALKSGDGEEGGEFRFRFTVLENDSDHDNVDGTTDYREWPSVEPGMILVSTTTDEVDTDYSQGNMSLREAIIEANLATEPTTIVLPTGRYSLTRTGTEASDATYNDLDVTGDLTIVGDGAGFTIIDTTSLTGSEGRALHLNTATAKLRLDKLTIANGANASDGQGVYVQSADTLEIYDSAIVNHEGWAGGSGVAVKDADVTIRRSVFVNNDNTSPNPGATGAALSVYTATSGGAALTLGQTIFANNVQANGNQYAVWTGVHVTKTNEGDNLYDSAAGGFFDTTSGTGDYLGTPDYVVTSVADTFNHLDNDEALSIREAVDLANAASGTDEIWLPAWKFTLTRDRATYGGGSATDTDVAFGDIDVSDNLVLRGVSDLSIVEWHPSVTDPQQSNYEDEVFKLLGDFNGDGETNQDMVGQDDYSIWDASDGVTGQATEAYRADADEDGDVDNDDWQIWQDHLYNTLGHHNVTFRI